jgi:hypothetical protein
MTLPWYVFSLSIIVASQVYSITCINALLHIYDLHFINHDDGFDINLVLDGALVFDRAQPAIQLDTSLTFN